MCCICLNENHSKVPPIQLSKSSIPSQSQRVVNIAHCGLQPVGILNIFHCFSAQICNKGEVYLSSGVCLHIYYYYLVYWFPVRTNYGVVSSLKRTAASFTYTWIDVWR